MYVRLRKNKSGTTSVFLIASMRMSGKKHSTYNVIKSFGSAEQADEVEVLKQQAELYKKNMISINISAKASINNAIKIQSADDIQSCCVKEIGTNMLYKEIFSRQFNGLQIKSIDDTSVLRDLTIMRIIKPASKHRTALVSSGYGINSLSHNQIYRQMDKIDDKAIEKIKATVYKNTINLLGEEKLQVLFYDLTTIYFEADSKSDLKAKGYSKDGKSQHVQVTLVFVVTQGGLPIDYELLVGNTYEGNTLIPVLDKIRSKYGIANVTVVADSAMLNKGNLAKLQEGGYEYIVAARVRNMSKAMTNNMFAQEDYNNLNDELRYKEIDDNGKRLIASHSKKRQRRDKLKREELIAKIKAESADVKSKLSSKYKQPYISLTKDSVIEINETKLQEASKFDGYFGYYTNSKLSAEEVIGHYRGLWQVEQTFRVTKHNLQIRPIYHYTDRRIKAHFALCFMALSMVRMTEHLLKKAGCYLPIERLHHELSKVKEVSLTSGKIMSKIITDITQEVKDVFRVLKVDLPKRLAFDYVG
jgi:transposase